MPRSFNDHVGGRLFTWWGSDNCACGPMTTLHQNSTWPNSRDVIARDMGHLAAADRAKLLNTNVTKLYNLKSFGVDGQSADERRKRWHAHA